MSAYCFYPLRYKRQGSGLIQLGTFKEHCDRIWKTQKEIMSRTRVDCGDDYDDDDDEDVFDEVRLILLCINIFR